MSALGQMEGRSNVWWRLQLKDAEPVLGIEDADGVPERAPEEEVLALSTADEAFASAANVHTRCVVDTGVGTTQLRVYFDGCSHQSGAQRGFSECIHHGCKRYKFVASQSRLAFAAEMYLWHQSTSQLLEDTKKCHLKYEPTAASVALMMPQVRLLNF